MQPVIELNGLTKRFGRQLALDRVTMTVPPGVVFAVLGENGAGKTTMIRIILGLLNADEGSANVLGLDSKRDGVSDSPAHRVCLGTSGIG